MLSYFMTCNPADSIPLTSILATSAKFPPTNAIKENYRTSCLCLCHMRKPWT